MISSVDFYEHLPVFRKFSEVANQSYYRPVPEDWFVIITDVEGSTAAIKEGRYKDVNTIGAAAIVLARQEMGKKAFPFVFGGDGATILCPGEDAVRVKEILLKLKNLAVRKFRLCLRVGMVQVGDVNRRGGAIEVAKFELVPGQPIAFIRGGGLTLAEKLVKNREQENEELSGNVAVELTGLSCRWNPIPSRRGRVLSVLVSSRPPADTAIFSEIIDRLDQMLESGLDGANPVDRSVMSYKTIRECIRDENRYHSFRGTFSYLKRLGEIVLAVLVFRLGLKPFVIDPDRYSHSMRTHADYRKFDDMLRMVIDCSAEESERIETFLKEMFDRGKIYYGIHSSDTALMTCYVEHLDDGGHIHFVDGGGGGYAIAAVQLKEQMRAGGGI